MSNTNVKKIKLSELENSKTFTVGRVEFIKFYDKDGQTIAMSKDILFNSRFGDNNNLTDSEIKKKLQKEFLPKIAEAVGEENICEFETDLTTLDGLKPYEPLKSKISLPTLDFYRVNVEIFDKYKVDDWWWLATPESAKPHWDPTFILCVAPSGIISYVSCSNSDRGVRPFLHFVSSISVSCEV